MAGGESLCGHPDLLPGHGSALQNQVKSGLLDKKSGQALLGVTPLL